MSLFRLDSSIRVDGSVSREVADALENAYVEQHPNATVTRRDLVADPLPNVWPVAAFAGFTPAEQRTDEQRAALAVAAGLADEVLRADAVVVATPLYNFGVPAHLKAWIDLLITDARFGPGTSPLAGRPVTLVIARGGGYGAGTPREGWDHATPYLVRILADVWGADLTVVEAELTLAPVTPAMAELIPLAEASRAQALEQAAAVGKAHAA
ncbi:FMN-dependent NADH-azoreductase [Pseudonocardia abyssalis]|uniref:FMN dependent NADH:quinone oxidoreductase n=1 Tax=Pseudonocardia abyssalis TaxID=2792008 RepID=A0ABS6UKX9_9PSEU|nr:NAD(P)H-dependent oxidoreductase [Pseudonocardia abyssalis]MBW0114916.1 NAD(P)H-dependent oxidoreductase [Pseudonocardia abyssalis]MBW0132882.1 NAD(P)H-dependent oxidoreductase [Pseudonocardia abyssalis]